MLLFCIAVYVTAALPWSRNGDRELTFLAIPRGGSETSYGRVSDTEYILTPEQIRDFHQDGCVTLDDVVQPNELDYFREVFDRFVRREIDVPGKDFCDISRPFGTPYKEWSLVNCMLPTRYYPEFQNNVYEQLTASIARQLFPNDVMRKDYDQFLNKRPGKSDAVFAWHQDMAYWPSSKVLGVNKTTTCTFSLAIDDSDAANGCLRYVRRSGRAKTLRPHRPLSESRENAHAVVADIRNDDEIVLAPARAGSITIHDEYVVHGSGGNKCRDRQRRTYVVAYREESIVEAERRIGFTHSHNDEVNWDTFDQVASDCTDD